MNCFRAADEGGLVVAMKVEVELKLKLKQVQPSWEGESGGKEPEQRVDGAGVAHSSAAQQLEGSCRSGIVTHAETLQQQQEQEEATAGGGKSGRGASKNLTCLWTVRVFGYAKGQNQHSGRWRTRLL